MQITWDRWAVPTITGSDEFEVTYGAGFAQATAHGRTVLEAYGIARGHAAALWGPDFVDRDRFTAQLGLSAMTEEWLSAQPAATMARIASFCDGFNDACAEDERRGTDRREVLPVTPRDVVAHMLRIFTHFGTLDFLGLAFPPEAFFKSAGSNSWAIAGTRSATGNALLVINPHLMWDPYWRWFELRSISPGRDFHGITLIGLPWQNMGHSTASGWGHTVNPIPNMSVYELDIDEQGYLFDGHRNLPRTTEHRIEVRGADPVTVVERQTVHGPVVTAPDGTEVAVRIAGVLHHPATSALECWWRMSLATSVEEIIAIQDEMPLPMLNLLSADEHGSIGALYCGTPPVRPGGDFSDSKRRMPGDDPAWLWDEVHRGGTMPRVVNPEVGWVQNCNETPWLYTTPLLKAEEYPPAIAPPANQVDDLRAPASRSWLSSQEKITPEALLGLKFSKRALLADIVLDQLCAAASDEEDLRSALEVLTAWDRHSHHDSKGYVLFMVWSSLNAPKIADRTLFEQAPVGGVPDGLADPAAAVVTLRTAVAALTSARIPLDSSIGQVHVLGSGQDAVPADGGSGVVGVLKSLELGLQENEFQMIVGDTYVSLIQFGPNGATTAENLLVYGNTTEDSAPHGESQFAIWKEDRLRPEPSPGS